MSNNENTEDQASKIQIFQLNEEEAKFDEIEFDPDANYEDLFDSNIILYFTNAEKYKSYIWTGKNASVRMKFIAANKASEVRDKIGPAIKITTIDEDEEPLAFQIMLGMAEEIDYEKDKKDPPRSPDEDEILLKELSLDKMVLLLEKIGCPEGYRREMVVEGKKVYGYQETYKEYMGEIIKERELYPLEKNVTDGSYLAEKLTPRLIMSYNQVVLIDLLRKLTPEEMEADERLEQKIQAAKPGAAPFMENGS
jgi:hypothetical protein